ncbi:hypothetical protein DCAR_0312396 [Daucus carota subsp. sativus]|uniref:WEB family protein n=2 Tax=Daucus carota subsp. sativus TaxID=79200 RepID=A0AAF0WS60_DAUCS|nr:hypothetical protein DCAR_0312396 [Daucus carota subsp. sativus]
MGHLNKTMDDYQYRAGESLDPCTNVLEIKMAELLATKNELKQAKDDATQSWLDSRPLIDKLEELHTELSDRKSQATKVKNDISGLKSQLQNTIISIRTKREDEVKLTELINQISQSLDHQREEMEKIKSETDEEDRERFRLKQVLLLKKQTLQALELTLRAAQTESEAFSASSANAIQHISRSHADNSVINLTQAEYEALRKEAHEQTSMADWRVSVAMEERMLAEKSRKLTQKRFKAQKRDIMLTKTHENTNVNEIVAQEPNDSKVKVGSQVKSRPNNFPLARAKLMAKNQKNSKQFDRSTGSHKRTVRRKKPSLFARIRDFLVRKITLWF